MTPKLRTLAVLLAPLALAACASGPKPQMQRGWIGGRYLDVSREFEIRPSRTPYEDSITVNHMPENAPGDAGALVTSAYAGSPLAAAGIAPGDLVCSIDGAPIDGSLDLYKRVESMTPGSHAKLSYWRDGKTREADLVVGRETYESAGHFQIGFPFPLWLNLDLWPFDDGIDLCGLVRVHWDHERNQLASPDMNYRRAVTHGEEDVVAKPQETLEIFVFPFGAGKGVRVLRQETVP